MINKAAVSLFQAAYFKHPTFSLTGSTVYTAHSLTDIPVRTDHSLTDSAVYTADILNTACTYLRPLYCP